MLEYLINNNALVLDSGTSVRISLRNPTCQFDKISGHAGLGIEIPVNDTNRALLGNPERFEKEATQNDREFPGFEIRFGGKLLLAGTFVVQNATGETYSGWLRGNVGTLKKEHQEKYISEIYAFDQEKTFTNKADYDPDTDDYGCPEIYNQDFFKDKGRTDRYDDLVLNPDYYPDSGKDQWITDKVERTVLSEAFRRTATYFVNKLNEDNTVKAEPDSAKAENIDVNLDVYAVSPMLFLQYVIKKLLNDAGFFIDSNAIADNDDLKKLIVYNNYDITTTTFEHVFPIDMHVVDWYDGVSAQNYVTIIKNVFRSYDGTFKYKNLLPQIKLPDFILGIQNLINVAFHFRMDDQVDIIDRETILSGNSIDLEEYLLGNWEIGEKKNTMLRFIAEHDEDDAWFQERWEDIEEERENEKDPVDDWEDLAAIADPEIGEVRYLKNLNIYVQYKWVIEEEKSPSVQDMIQKDSLGWQQIALGFQNGLYNVGKDDEEEIKTPFSTLMGDQTVYCYQKGNMKAMKHIYENFSPRLLFYLGSNSAKYETENISLDWEKETTGLLNSRWRNWARFWCQRQPVKTEANLPLNVFDYVARNIYKKFRGREGEFIIEEMECEFGISSIGNTKISGYKADFAPQPYTLSHYINPSDVIWLDDYFEIGGGLEQFYPLIVP